MQNMFIALIFLIAQAQQPEVSPDLDLLRRIQIRMAENISRLPNYTCLQTIERLQRRPGAADFEPRDRVRLEVALIEGKEVFGWPGGDKIAESEITNLVSGTIGNGNFALFLKNILSGAAGFRYAGDAEINGRRAVRFDYFVPLINSGYHLQVPPHEALVPYHGTLWVASDSLDLIRLEITVDAMPPFLGIEAASDVMYYGRVEIAGATFLLPQCSELSLTQLHGAEHRNRTRFTTCREFRSESLLTVGSVPPGAPEQRPASIARMDLGDNFEADFTLDTSIDPATSAVGDPIRAKLQRDVKLTGRAVIPKGSELRCRITVLEKIDHSYKLDIAPVSIDFNRARADLNDRKNTLSIELWSHDLHSDDRIPSSRETFAMRTTPVTIPAAEFRVGKGTGISVRSRRAEPVQ